MGLHKMDFLEQEAGEGALGKVTVTDQVDARAFLQILGLRRHPDGPSQRMRSRTQEAT